MKHTLWIMLARSTDYLPFLKYRMTVFNLFLRYNSPLGDIKIDYWYLQYSFLILITCLMKQTGRGSSVVEGSFRNR